VTTTGEPARGQHPDPQRATGPTTASIEDQIRAAADRYEAEIRAAGDRYDKALGLILEGALAEASTALTARPSRPHSAPVSATT
jgi:hypothetical protein